jgi:hypothetical protein
MALVLSLKALCMITLEVDQVEYKKGGIFTSAALLLSKK